MFYSHIKEYLYLFGKIIKIPPFQLHIYYEARFLIHSSQNILQQMIAGMGFLPLS